MTISRMCDTHRTLIGVIVLLVSCGASYGGDEFPGSSAAEAIEALIAGGNGVIWRNLPTGMAIESITLVARPSAPAVVGHDFQELSALHLSYQGITTSDVQWAAGLANVTSLTLDGTGIAWSDATIPEIVRRLRDRQKQIVPTDISCLGNASSLRELLLWMTPSDPRQLRVLSKLKNLTDLDLRLPSNASLHYILENLPPSVRRLCLRNITAAHLTRLAKNAKHYNVDDLTLWLAEDARKDYHVRDLLSCVPRVSVVRMCNATVTIDVVRSFPASVTAIHFTKCRVTTKALRCLGALPRLNLLELYRCRLATSDRDGATARIKPVYRGLRFWGTVPPRWLAEDVPLQAVEELVFQAVRSARFDPGKTPHLKSLSVQFGCVDLRRLADCPQSLRSIEFKCVPELPEGCVESFVRRTRLQSLSLKYCDITEGRSEIKRQERMGAFDALIMYRCRNIPESVFQAIRDRGGAVNLLVTESIAIKAIHASSPALQRLVVDLSHSPRRNQGKRHAILRLKTAAPCLRQLVVIGPTDRTLDVVRSAPRQLRQLHVHVDSNQGEALDIGSLLPANGGHERVHLKLSGDIVRCTSLSDRKFSTIEFCAPLTGAPVTTEKMLLTTSSLSGSCSARRHRIPGPLTGGLWGIPSRLNEWWLGMY